MKTKHSIYFLLILLGAALMASGDRLIRKEYALSIGISLLMFCIYKVSRSWGQDGRQESGEEQKNP